MKPFISLKNKREFDKVYNCRWSVANKYLIMFICKNELGYNRVGISISKKVGNSVVRHRITRLLRESYRLNSSAVKDGYDIVVVARNSVKDKSYYEVESALLHLFKLLKINSLTNN